MYREIYNELKRRERQMQKTAALPDALLRILGRNPAPAKPNILKKLLPLLGIGAAGGAVAAIPEAREAVGGAASSVGNSISDLLSQLRGGSEPTMPGRGVKKTNATTAAKPEAPTNPAAGLQGILSSLGVTPPMPGRGNKPNANPLSNMMGTLGLSPQVPGRGSKKINPTPTPKPATKADPQEIIKLLQSLGVNVQEFFGQ